MYAEVPGTEAESKDALLDLDKVYEISRFQVKSARLTYMPFPGKLMIQLERTQEMLLTISTRKRQEQALDAVQPLQNMINNGLLLLSSSIEVSTMVLCLQSSACLPQKRLLYHLVACFWSTSTF